MPGTLIRGALVLPGGGDWRARRGDLFIRDGKFVADLPGEAERTIDGRNLLAVPGFIEPGRSADLVLYDLTRPRWIPCNDAAQQLVFAETGDSVHTVLVAGRIVVDRGKVTGIDMQALLAEARGMVGAIRKRNRALHDAVSGLL